MDGEDVKKIVLNFQLNHSFTAEEFREQNLTARIVESFSNNRSIRKPALAPPSLDFLSEKYLQKLSILRVAERGDIE